MKWVALFSLVLAPAAFALCDADLALPRLDRDLEALGAHMEEKHWHAANDKDIENAACLQPKKDYAQQAERYFANKYASKKVSDEVFGLALEDHPEKIELLKKLLEVSDNTFYGKEEQPFYSAPECKTVDCAAASVFGPKRGKKFLYALERFGMNMSETRVEDSAPWENDDIDNILKSLDDLPSTLLPIDGNRMLVNLDYDKGSTIANATMVFFKSYLSDTLAMKRYTVTHEIGHNAGMALDFDDSQKWLDLSGWEEKEGKWTASNPDALSSVYADTNPAEDFAETFAAYRYNPSLLKDISQEKYDYMKHYVFHGLEYDAEENCQGDKAYANQLSVKYDLKTLENGYPKCREEIAALLINKANPEKMKSCLLQNSLSKSLNAADFSLPAQVDEELVKSSMDILGKNFVPPKAQAPSDQFVQEAYRQVADDLIKSFTERYYNYKGDCSSAAKYGDQNFTSFSEQKLGDSMFSYYNKVAFNQLAVKACELDPTKRKIGPDDPGLKEIFYELIPN